MTQELFVYPGGLCFECTRCGDCCRSSVRIQVGPDERAVLEALDWRGRADDLVGESTCESLGSRFSLRRRPDGACIFLGEANQCRIHEHFGEETKPLMCRLFPFGFLAVGGRIAVDVSFACRSVSQGSGPALDTRVAEWETLFPERPERGDGHPFSPKHAVPGELLWELEEGVVALLTEGSMTLFDRVRAVEAYMRLAMTSDPTTEAARTLRRVMAEGVPKQIRERRAEGTMDKTQRAVFFHLLFLSLNPTPPELLGASGKSAKKQIALRVRAADTYEFPDARPWVGNQPLARSHREIEAIEDGVFLESATDAFVARFLAAKLVGQRFMHEDEREIAFTDAVPRLLLLYPMAIWTAKALAADAGRSEVREEEIRKAVRLLDRSFGQVRLGDLPAKQRKAWRFVMTETELPVVATLDLLHAYNAR